MPCAPGCASRAFSPTSASTVSRPITPIYSDLFPEEDRRERAAGSQQVALYPDRTGHPVPDHGHTAFLWLPEFCPRGGGAAGGRLRSGDPGLQRGGPAAGAADRKSTRLNSSHVKISYAVFSLIKKTSYFASRH